VLEFGEFLKDEHFRCGFYEKTNMYGQTRDLFSPRDISGNAIISGTLDFKCFGFRKRVARHQNMNRHVAAFQMRRYYIETRLQFLRYRERKKPWFSGRSLLQNAFWRNISCALRWKKAMDQQSSIDTRQLDT